MTIIDMDKMGEALNTKADIDLNNTGVFSTSEGGVVNLTSSTPVNASGKEVTSADFFQSNLLNYTTNRILEIPQDIKLELNNGTLTLKAGSKVYVPNGFEADGTTPKFDAVVVESDLTAVLAFNGAVVCYLRDTSTTPIISAASLSNETGSGTGTGSSLYYSTDNNRMYLHGSDVSSCFPFAIATSNGTQFTSIDQVFNGFGYIGSAVFVLPGVKVQAPNGRNKDGTCRSIIATVDSVKTITRADSLTTSIHWYLTSNLSAYSSNIWSFDADKNIYVSSSGVMASVEIAHGYLTSGKITSFEPFTVDSVLNSNLSNLSAAGEAKLKSNIQLVNELPANPEPGVLYCIPEA